jgi:hypothetical protein
MATTSNRNGDGARGASAPRARRRAEDAPTIRETAAPKVTHDADVLEWTRNKIRRGWTRNRIVAASKSGEEGWPAYWPEGLSNGTLSSIRAAIDHVEQYERLSPRKRRPKYSGRRLRELAEQRKREGYPALVDVQRRVNQAMALVDTIDVLPYLDDEDDEFVLREMHEDVAELASWADHVIALTSARLTDAEKRETIRKLRNVSGRTETEARAFLRRADKLEAKLDARLDS